MAVQISGKVAEVWQGGRQLGTLWDWRFDGADGDWEASANEQTIAPEFLGGECEVRFMLTAKSGDLFHIRGTGCLENYVAGRCRRAITIRGSRAWTVTGTLALT